MLLPTDLYSKLWRGLLDQNRRVKARVMLGALIHLGHRFFFLYQENSFCGVFKVTTTYWPLKQTKVNKNSVHIAKSPFYCRARWKDIDWSDWWNCSACGNTINKDFATPIFLLNMEWLYSTGICFIHGPPLLIKFISLLVRVVHVWYKCLWYQYC